MAPPQVNFAIRLKLQLKLAIARLRMAQQRDDATSRAQRRAMAQLLEAGKTDSARIRVENIIRADVITELHEALELYCELLLARAGLLEGPQCDPGLEEAVRSIIYAAPRMEIKELQSLRLLFGEKYGKDFVASSMENTDDKVSKRVVRKLRVTPPRQELVEGYLEEIAKAYSVNWPRQRQRSSDIVAEGNTSASFGRAALDIDEQGGGGGSSRGAAIEASTEPGNDDNNDNDNDDGGGDDEIRDSTETDSVVPSTENEESLMRATPPRTLGGPTSPIRVAPPRMTTENPNPRLTLNSQELKPVKSADRSADARRKSSGNNDARGGALDLSSLEELERRFAALKRQ